MGRAGDRSGGRYVYIGDLWLSPENTDNLVVQYAYWGVNDHPGQWGHEHIAERVIAALQAK
jgi:phospholipase/lecithinase/hemolysin